MMMNIARLTGWTPRVVMWEIAFPTLMRMLDSIESSSTTEKGRVEVDTPGAQLIGAGALGIPSMDLR